MERYPLIFSNDRRYRLQRHFLLWFCWWLFSSFIYAFSPGIIRFSYLKRLPVSAFEALFYLVPHMVLTYSFLYFVIPNLLLKGKYLKTVVAVLCMFLVTAVISTTIGIYVLSPVRSAFFGQDYFPVHIYEISFFLGLLAGLRGGITIGGLAAAIKLTKHWYVKEQRNLQLQKENISSQLEILKAQAHPHFLFNTLNNIYSNTQVSSPVAANMIMGLSGLLRYILYECNQPLVPLSRELSMLQQYIDLEKARYGNELEIMIELPKKETGLAVSPLILLPFVENCFRHGTSKMLEQPWISLQISVDEDCLKMKLLNGKVADTLPSHIGIGLANVKKRLELLYPEKHELVITDEEEVFIVNLKVLLEKSHHKTSPILMASHCFQKPVELNWL